MGVRSSIPVLIQNTSDQRNADSSGFYLKETRPQGAQYEQLDGGAVSRMIPQADQPGTPLTPSAKTLASASAAALLAAAVILVTAVLPAEYGIDPLGTGRVLGFSALSQPLAVPEPVEPPVGAALAPVQAGSVAWYPGEYRVDSRTLVLGPYEFIEFKYHLAKDAVMLFSWTASDNVLQEFHGDPDGAGSDATQSFDKQPRRKADGTFTAPFSGIHGWYWENPGGDTVTVKLTTAGFYTSAHEFHYDRTRYVRQVQDLSAIATNDQ